MPTNTGNEAQLQAEIEALRGQFSNTQDLYREVCALLFFRHGVTPTANKLYQLVRKGSMSAPAEALGKFWIDLREKSRVRIEHPDLPESLRTAAGELAAALWSEAQAHAQEGLTALRSEADASVLEAKAAQAVAEGDRDKARSETTATQASLTAATKAIRDAEQQRVLLERHWRGSYVRLERTKSTFRGLLKTRGASSLPNWTSTELMHSLLRSASRQPKYGPCKKLTGNEPWRPNYRRNSTRYVPLEAKLRIDIKRKSRCCMLKLVS